MARSHPKCFPLASKRQRLAPPHYFAARLGEECTVQNEELAVIARECLDPPVVVQP